MKDSGYNIQATNWRAGRHGEIDLIAHQPVTRTLVFVEVKSRLSQRFGTPVEAITRAKQEQLLYLAERYLGENPQLSECTVRFDVIGIAGSTLEHLENAFDQSTAY